MLIHRGAKTERTNEKLVDKYLPHRRLSFLTYGAPVERADTGNSLKSSDLHGHFSAVKTTLEDGSKTGRPLHQRKRRDIKGKTGFHQRMIQHRSVLQCADRNPACVQYRGH